MADSYVYPNAPRGKRDYDENSERRQRPRNSSGSDVCYDFQKGRYVRVLLNECKCPGDIIKSMTVALAYMYSSLRVPDARRAARPTFGVAGTPRLTAP